MRRVGRHLTELDAHVTEFTPVDDEEYVGVGREIGRASGDEYADRR